MIHKFQHLETTCRRCNAPDVIWQKSEKGKWTLYKSVWNEQECQKNIEIDSNGKPITHKCVSKTNKDHIAMKLFLSPLKK